MWTSVLLLTLKLNDIYLSDVLGFGKSSLMFCMVVFCNEQAFAV